MPKVIDIMATRRVFLPSSPRQRLPQAVKGWLCRINQPNNYDYKNISLYFPHGVGNGSP